MEELSLRQALIHKMQFLRGVWRQTTQCKALEQSSGRYETLFFESIYRVTYIAGFAILDDSIPYLIYSSFIKTMISLLLICETWHLLSDTTNLDVLIDNITVTMINFTTLYRYINMRQNKFIYKKLVSAMESPYFDISTENREKIFNFWVQRNERFLILLLVLAGCTLGIWCVYPLVDDIDYNLMVSARFPFEYQTPVRYPILYMSVYMAFSYSSTFVLLNDLIMQAHLMHLLCQYNILCNCFESIISDSLEENEFEHSETILTNKFREKYLKKLNNLVNQHKFILDNTMEFKKSLSKPMLAQLTASGFLICFLGYQASVNADPSNAKFFMSLLYILYALFQLFIFCKWCDEIKIQSENIADSVYCSGWEKGIAAMPGVRARLLLVAIRARRPVIFTAGSLFELSLASYTTLVKTSYSAVTVLRRFQ